MKRKPQLNKILNNIEHIKKLKSQGAKDTDIISYLKMSRTTFYKYVNECPELAEALNAGEEKLCDDLESDMYRLARGGYVLTTKKTVIKSDKDGKEVILEEITEKEQPPNLGALIFILKNKRKDKWQNEPNAIDLRRDELKLKEKIAENNAW